MDGDECSSGMANIAAVHVCRFDSTASAALTASHASSIEWVLACCLPLVIGAARRELISTSNNVCLVRTGSKGHID